MLFSYLKGAWYGYGSFTNETDENTKEQLSTFIECSHCTIN